MDIDLDAAKAARREVENGHKPHRVKIGKKWFNLADEMPWDLTHGLATGEYELIAAGVKALLGEGWPAFRKMQPSREDIITLSIQASAAFGLGDKGESEASGDSPSNTSRRSRRTSSVSIPSTSEKRSGAKTRSQ